MSASIEVSIKILDQSAVCPSYAYPGDAGVDLRSVERVVLKPFGRALVSTGIALAIPEGFAGFVQPRSGLAAKHGVTVLNTPGLIDSHYRGEIKVILINLDPEHEFVVEPGDRIAQLVIQKVEHVAWTCVDALDDTERGSGGFVSSAVH